MSVSSGNVLLDKSFVISDAAIAVYRMIQGDTTDSTNITRVGKAATSETTKPIGITQDATAAADEVIPIRLAGISLIEVDGSGTAIDIGDEIVAKASGIGVISTTPDATDQWSIGYAMEPSAASGDIIEVMIRSLLIVKGTA